MLGPPSPPAAPHLGTLYTLSLLDAAKRMSAYLGRPALVPEAWNLSSRRIESQFADEGEEYFNYCAGAVAQARSILAKFGIDLDQDVPVRDDVHESRVELQSAVVELCERGEIAERRVEEKWCFPCQLALPATSATTVCFQCGKDLQLRQTTDWFLRLDTFQIFERAIAVRWNPPYALRRFQNLKDINPWYRVQHGNRRLGVPSPLSCGQILDPRLVAALYPTVLRGRGFTGPITLFAGMDIQRKWLVLTLGANRSDALPVGIVNHGVLLDASGRKLSRYTGASIADSSETSEFTNVRAALLSCTLGKDIVAARIPIAAASRLREKAVNCLKYLRLQPTVPDSAGVDVDSGMREALGRVDQALIAGDVTAALAYFRKAVVKTLSNDLIPQVRKQGLRRCEQTQKRLEILFTIFFGPEPRLHG